MWVHKVVTTLQVPCLMKLLVQLYAQATSLFSVMLGMYAFHPANIQ